MLGANDGSLDQSPSGQVDHKLRHRCAWDFPVAGFIEEEAAILESQTDAERNAP